MINGAGGLKVNILPDSEVFANYAPEINSVGDGIREVGEVAGLDIGFTELSEENAAIISMMSQGLRNARGQISAEGLLDVAQNVRLCSPDSPAVILLSEDLAANNTNFVFGFAIKEIGLVVQSLHRFVGERNRSLAIKHIARHEFGHLLGLDGQTIKSQENRTGLFTGHCVNDCTMQQYMSVSEATTAARRLANRPDAGFCGDCSDVLTELHS